MKMLNIFYFLLFSSVFIACGTDVVSDEEDDITINSTDNISTSDTITANTPTLVLVPPPVTKDREIIEKKNTAKSPLLDKGCCSEEGKSTDSCCCDAVLKQYKKWKEEGFTGLGELKSTDPILGKCRKKYKEQFDLIDFPPLPVEKEDDYNDLLGSISL